MGRSIITEIVIASDVVVDALPWVSLSRLVLLIRAELDVDIVRVIVLLLFHILGKRGHLALLCRACGGE